MPITVLVADDHAVIRDGLRILLRSHTDLDIVGTAAGGREAVDAAVRLRPDVALLDISMPGVDGIEAARLIHAACPQTRIIMLSMHEGADHVRRAVEAGASGYLLKDARADEIATALRAVHAGRRYFTERAGKPPAVGAATALDSLSARELEILRLVADGHGNAEAAQELGLSVKTVETYRSRLMQKLGLGSVAELVKFALSHGLTQLR
jgi:DNA-binding NarL/FixJ family response regulator